MRTNRRICRIMLSASLVAVLAGCAAGPSSNGRDVTGRDPSSEPAAASSLDIARREFGRGNYGTAIKYLEEELAQKPASVAALNGLGACYDQLGRFDVAQRYYFRALDLAPESSQTLSNIGYSYLQQGRHREAEAVLELALLKDAGNQVAANNLSLARADGVEEAPPARVARSTNIGVADDELDFSALLALLQGSEGSTVGGVLTVPGADLGNQAGVVITPAGDNPPSTPSVAVGLADSPVDTPPAADRAADAQVPPAPALMQPESIDQPATTTLVREPAEVVTLVLEPVSEPVLVSQEPEQLTLTILEAQQSDLVRASDVTPLISSLAEPLRLVIQNGNGVRGIAQATSNWLVGDKLEIQSVHDADNYDYLQSVIFYRPELWPYAQEIAATLNVSGQLTPSNELAPGADVQVVLGHDFASQVSVENGGLFFKPLPSTNYLQATIRVEVANGNGVNGMAARVREYLQAKGANVVKITDAENFDYPGSLLYYRSGTQVAAEAVAASLPLAGVLLIESEGLDPAVDTRLVVGRDFIPLGNLVLN